MKPYPAGSQSKDNLRLDGAPCAILSGFIQDSVELPSHSLYYNRDITLCFARFDRFFSSRHWIPVCVSARSYSPMEFPLEQLLMSVSEVCATLAMGRTKFYQEVAAGRLTMLKRGSRSLVRCDDVRRYADQLTATPQ